MGYDPFVRGPYPVGVRTLELTDPARARRRLPTELWYPAVDAHAGADLADDSCDRYQLLPGLPPSLQQAVRDAAPRPGGFPLVLFSHGFGGHRRQSTFLCTHLASHGYVVAAPDHTGNTAQDLAGALLGGGERSGAEAEGGGSGEQLDRILAQRPADIGFVIDRLFAGEPQATGRILEGERVAVTGHSFGGWTALAVTARDPRVAVTFVLAPAGGRGTPGGSRMRDALDLEWTRVVPTVVVAAARDSILPLDGIRELYRELLAPKKLLVLENADHLHFCDNAARMHDLFRSLPNNLLVPGASSLPPFSELCPAERGHDLARAVGLAQLDAFLKGRADAKRFLAGDLAALLAERGIAVEIG